MTVDNKSKVFTFLAIGVSAILYVILAYFTPRENFYQVITCFSLLFGAYFFFISKYPKSVQLNTILYVAIGFRALHLFALPELSDDYFRFIWDGLLTTKEISPFELIPTQVGDLGVSTQKYLLEQMNSPNYFSVYPPVCQFVFALGAFISPNSVWGAMLVMKVCFLLFEIGSIFLIKHLLTKLDLGTHKVVYYALNPLVIVEFCGNLHFEGSMVFFTLLAITLLVWEQFYQSAVLFGFAICTKFLPVLFLPFLFRRFGFVKSFLYGLVAGITSIALFYPFMDQEILLNIGDSLGLYFNTFEFNGSFYYLSKWLRYEVWEHSPKFFGLITLVLYLLVLIKRDKNTWESWFEGIALTLTLYFAFASTVHPWYIAGILPFFIFTKHRYLLVWTALLPLTYITYQTKAYEQNFYFVCLEYGVVYTLLILDLIKKEEEPKDLLPMPTIGGVKKL
ncbi:MAG: hypothetical protein GY827_10225 [Cytophagales bacterium]|nr:hypothetical protein [Cytophagales bacterium]